MVTQMQIMGLNPFSASKVCVAIDTTLNSDGDADVKCEQALLLITKLSNPERFLVKYLKYNLL